MVFIELSVQADDCTASVCLKSENLEFAGSVSEHISKILQKSN